LSAHDVPSAGKASRQLEDNFSSTLHQSPVQTSSKFPLPIKD